MKKLFFLWIALCVVNFAQAQIVVNTTAGNLSADLIVAAGGESNVGSITDLKINGTLGEQDFTDLRSAVGANLVKIDLSGITAIENQTLPSGAFTGGFFTQLETVILPEKKSGTPVITTISSAAFQSTSKLKSVNIPDGVTEIGISAFNYSAISSLVLPNSVITIGNSIFEESSIETITLSENLTAIPNNAFFKARSLKSIHISGSVQSIGINAFNQASELETVTFGEGITSIGDAAAASTLYLFASTKVKSITLPNSVTAIGRGAFYNASELELITLSQNLETIGESAFVNTKLKSISLPNGLKSIGNSAFAGVSTITEIILPENLQLLGGYGTFSGTGISSLVIPPNTQVVGVLSGTFTNAANLNSLTLNSNITSIGADAFSGTTSLKELVIPEGVTELEKRALYNNSLERLELPNSLKTISGVLLANGQFATSGTDNTTLTYLKIGSGLETIVDYAFDGFTALKILVVNAVLPPLLDPNTKANVFRGVAKRGCVLYVPAEGLVSSDEYDNYRTAPVWKEFIIKEYAPGKGFQSIVWPSFVQKFSITQTTEVGSFSLPAKTEQGFDISYNINDNTIATVSGNKINIVAAVGEALITATVLENENYNALEEIIALKIRMPIGGEAVNLVRNGGFETWSNPNDAPDEWTYSTTSSVTFSKNTTDVKEGLNTLSVVPTNNSNKDIVQKDISGIESEAIYALSVWYKIIQEPNSQNATDGVTFIWNWKNADNASLGSSNSAGHRTTGGWIQFKKEITAPVETEKVELIVRVNRQTNVLFDDIQLRIERLAILQSISWTSDVVNGVINQTTSNASFTLPEKTDQKQTIHYSIDSDKAGIATVSGNTVSIHGPGDVVITAVQEGTLNYLPMEEKITLVVTQGSGLWNTKNNTKFDLQGNPVQNEARFIFTEAGNGASIVIIDLTGKIVASENIGNGANEAVVNVSSLAKGVYVARYTDGNGKQGSVKLVK